MAIPPPQVLRLGHDGEQHGTIEHPDVARMGTSARRTRRHPWPGSTTWRATRARTLADADHRPAVLLAVQHLLAAHLHLPALGALDDAFILVEAAVPDLGKLGLESFANPFELGGEIMSGTTEAQYVKLGDIETDAVRQFDRPHWHAELLRGLVDIH